VPTGGATGGAIGSVVVVVVVVVDVVDVVDVVVDVVNGATVVVGLLSPPEHEETMTMLMSTTATDRMFPFFISLPCLF
jgi:hypothetical protein